MGDEHAKGRAAALSVASNTTLIALKLIAGVATGSVAILTEAVHSSIDLLASLVAFVSVRKADEPADAEHLYGHEKMENLAAATEGALILLGAAIITYEAITRLIHGATCTRSASASRDRRPPPSSTSSSRGSSRGGPRDRSVALAGDATHLSADAFSSLAVLVGLVLIAITHDYWIDPVVALLVAAASSSPAPVCCGAPRGRSSTRRCPRRPRDDPRSDPRGRRPRGVVGFHKLRSRSAGSRRYIDVHVQFAAGTTLEEAHWAAHAMTDEIGSGSTAPTCWSTSSPRPRASPGANV
jgi:divalent metal cation (Fe/Co/Zn/Cd) transporter